MAKFTLRVSDLNDEAKIRLYKTFEGRTIELIEERYGKNFIIGEMEFVKVDESYAAEKMREQVFESIISSILKKVSEKSPSGCMKDCDNCDIRNCPGHPRFKAKGPTGPTRKD